MSALIEQLRSLARFEHADLSIGDEAADEIERLGRGDYMEGFEEGAAGASRRALLAERRLSIAVEALEIIAKKRQCLDNLMGNQDVAEDALRLIAAPVASGEGT